VLWAYLDESGTHKGSSSVKVAGFVGNENEWRYFQNKWVKKLAQYNMDYFHAKNPNCDALRPHLAKEIIKRNLYGVGCSINPDDYNNYASHQFKSTIGNAYAICAFICAIHIADIAKDNNWGPVSFVLESGQPNVNFVGNMLKSMINDDRFNIAGVMIAGKKVFIPLQTADFLVHLYDAQNEDDKKWFNYLIKNGNLNYVNIPNDEIERTSQTIKQLYSRQRYLRNKTKR
jgi:hypothetical protein